MTYWMSVVSIMGGTFILVIIASSVHEIAHAIQFKKVLGYWPSLKFKFPLTFEVGEEQDYDGLSDEEFGSILISGVVGGTIPLILAMAADGIIGLCGFLASCIYIAASKSDIKQYANINRGKQNEP